jgi:hypothetical protein
VIVLLQDVDSRIYPVRVSVWRRFVARLLAIQLDRQLASGVAPESGALLAVRAVSIARPSYRHRLAMAMSRIVTEAKSQRPHPRNWVSMNWAAVSAGEPELLELCHRLDAPVPVSARGVALVSELLGDGCGPLLHAARAGQLRAAARNACDALDPSSDW